MVIMTFLLLIGQLSCHVTLKFNKRVWYVVTCHVICHVTFHVLWHAVMWPGGLLMWRMHDLSPTNLYPRRQNFRLGFLVNSSTDCSLPYISATLGTHVLKCLIDTGSSAHLLNYNCLHKLKQIPIHETTVKLCGINKSSVNVHGESQVYLVIVGKTCPVDVIIADISAPRESF